jgi:PST family polysaccharide transporter
MSLAQRAVRATLFVFISSYVNMGAGLVYGILMARLLDPVHFGIVALGTFLFSLVDVRGKLGLDYAFIHRQTNDEALAGTHWFLQTGTAAVTGLVCLLVIPFLLAGSQGLQRLGYQLQPEVIVTVLALVVIAVIEAAGSTARSSLEKELDFGRSTVVITTALLSSYAVAVLLAWRGLTYWALIGQLATNAALGTLGAWWMLRRSAPGRRFPARWEPRLARWMLRYGATVAVGAIATVVLLQYDNFLVGILAGAAALGYYAQAYRITQWPTGLVTHVIARASLPTYARVQNEPARLGRAFEMSLWMILMLSLPLGLALFIAAPEFVRLLYGDKWLPAAALIRLLVVYASLRPLLDDTGALFVSIGQPGRITAVLVMQALVLVLAATPLTLVYGVVGTTLGVGLAFIVGIALTYRFVARTLPIRLLPLFGPAGIAAAVSLGVGIWLNQSSVTGGWPLAVQVVFKGGCTAVVFVLVALLLQGRSAVERLRYLLGLLRRADPTSQAAAAPLPPQPRT